MAPSGQAKPFKTNETVHVDILKFLMFTLAVTWDRRQRNTAFTPSDSVKRAELSGGHVLKPFQGCLEKLCGRRDMGDPSAP